jgi:8-oxo-dGTP pyrophosphatase MutT (NUDIX family)
MECTCLRSACSVQEAAGLKSIDVVVGIVFCKDKFLAEKRKANERIDPGIICLPGGHVEPKETRDSALMREMKEELNIEVKKQKFIKKSSWVASNGERQNVYYYLVLNYEGQPSCLTAEELLWIENVNELDIEIDRQAVKESRAILRQAESRGSSC